MEEGYDSWLNPLLFRISGALRIIVLQKSFEIQIKNAIYMKLAKKL